MTVQDVSKEKERVFTKLAKNNVLNSLVLHGWLVVLVAHTENKVRSQMSLGGGFVEGRSRECILLCRPW